MALTATEITQITGHLGWSVTDQSQAYTVIYVTPTLNSISNVTAEAEIRKILANLETVQTQLGTIVENFEIAKLKGIEFSDIAEARLWGMYADWVVKLARFLNLAHNYQWGGGGSGSNKPRGGRVIL